MTDSRKWDIEGTLALGASHPVGRYRHDLATGRWWWSDETYRIHGFEPGEVVPTTELILAHKHPDDRDRVSQVLRRACVTGEPFSSVHRIMDAHGDERTLAVVGEGRTDEAGAVCELVGFFTDVTPAVARIADARATSSIRASAASRAAIEQAKAIVMCAVRTDMEGAFDWLREASNHSNVPLRDLSARIVALASASNGDMRVVAEALADLLVPRSESPTAPR
ncbi:PAS and ANTAR domain-containing protein [Isoptericola sp. NPDC057653]|uniref:PAS and ANTAR domain-containing protein n=1 Tax=Isoptericola sp. NPDC057653 TaxID=3346195 RepID=UPI003684915D